MAPTTADIDDVFARDSAEWRLAAEVMAKGASKLFRSHNPFEWVPAAVLAHHSLERLLKSALIQEGYAIAKGGPRSGAIWGHSLVELAHAIESKRPDFPRDIEQDLAVFDAYFCELRYPTESIRMEGLGEDEAFLFQKLMDRIRPYAGHMRYRLTDWDAD